MPWVLILAAGLALSGPLDLALRQAQHFAAWKIGSAGAAEGFVTAEALERLVNGENQ